jgi:hypothetical protein
LLWLFPTPPWLLLRPSGGVDPTWLLAAWGTSGPPPRPHPQPNWTANQTHTRRCYYSNAFGTRWKINFVYLTTNGSTVAKGVTSDDPDMETPPLTSLDDLHKWNLVKKRTHDNNTNRIKVNSWREDSK